MKELCLLMLHQSLLLPSLKLLLESGDESLQALALEQISAVTKVCPVDLLLLVSKSKCSAFILINNNDNSQLLYR